MFGNKKLQSLGRNSLKNCLENINTARLRLENLAKGIEERKHQGSEKLGDNEKIQIIKKL